MQGIVIQGPTQYFKEVSECWKNWPNVVWSTWSDEPQSNIDYIKSQGIEVIQSILPNISGDLNVNYQCASTFIGLNYLHRKGCTEVLKIRSDHTVNKPNELLESLWGRKMAFIAISNGERRPGIYYELEGRHLCHDYPSDNLIYGKINDMMIMFNFQADKNYGIPPESLIAYNYMTNVRPKIQFILNYENFIEHKMSFFLGDCINKDIKIFWLKRELEMVSFYNNDYYKF